uniref:Uncharacterized protein n=1 Tax=Globodera pallida TaxID=36090 RepID=A0A183BUF2_GLOPA
MRTANLLQRLQKTPEVLKQFQQIIDDQLQAGSPTAKCVSSCGDSRWGEEPRAVTKKQHANICSIWHRQRPEAATTQPVNGTNGVFVPCDRLPTSSSNCCMPGGGATPKPSGPGTPINFPACRELNNSASWLDIPASCHPGAYGRKRESRSLDAPRAWPEEVKKVLRGPKGVAHGEGKTDH